MSELFPEAIIHFEPIRGNVAVPKSELKKYITSYIARDGNLELEEIDSENLHELGRKWHAKAIGKNLDEYDEQKYRDCLGFTEPTKAVIEFLMGTELGLGIEIWDAEAEHIESISQLVDICARKIQLKYGDPRHNIHPQIDRMKADVAFLTNIQPPRNAYNVESLNRAAEYIENEFKKIHWNVNVEEFEADSSIYKNISCAFGNENKPRIIIGAHYDVAENTPGADDNASAVAGLLELARLFAGHLPTSDYYFEFVAYACEEPPYFYTENMGSYIHANRLAKEKTTVKAMICLEMIGYFSDEPNSQRFPAPQLSQLYPSTGNFIAIVGLQQQQQLVNHMHTFMQQASNIEVQKFVATEELVLSISMSDHINYWKHNFPAVMINDTSYYRNPNYHLESDTIETLNFDKMAEVVKGVFWAMINFKK